jgi:hypothetical protein
MADQEKAPVADVAGVDWKAKSANIHGDKRMEELKNYMRSHQHETRLRETAELEERVPSAAENRAALRSEGCEEMNDAMKQLSNQEAFVPYVAKTGELPEAFREKPSSTGNLKEDMETRMALLRRMNRFETRIGWREVMDHSLKRLVVDVDLSRDERLKEYGSKAPKMDPSARQEEKIQQTRFAKARCEHLNKIYQWYEIHGMKEARKERKSPPYLTYNPQHPVMPGSMRVAPPLRELLNKDPARGMGHSMSSPALLAAGAAAAATPSMAS